MSPDCARLAPGGRLGFARWPSGVVGLRLRRLTYASQPFGFDEPTLAGILLDARRCNLRDDISGALVCRADLYLQLLEGPEALVEATYERIARDNRHLEVQRLFARPIEARIFAAWAMREVPVRSWMWSVEAVANEAARRASAQKISGVFARLASEPAGRE